MTTVCTLARGGRPRPPTRRAYPLAGLARGAMRWVPLLACLALAPLTEGRATAGWQPPRPAPDEFDWVQLTSGEWLKGEIIDLYRGDLAFDSDVLDLQVLDWEDVKELRSAAMMRVSFEDGQVVTGRILMDEQTIRILGEPERQFPRSRSSRSPERAPVSSTTGRRRPAWAPTCEEGTASRSS